MTHCIITFQLCIGPFNIWINQYSVLYLPPKTHSQIKRKVILSLVERNQAIIRDSVQLYCQKIYDIERSLVSLVIKKSFVTVILTFSPRSDVKILTYTNQNIFFKKIFALRLTMFQSIFSQLYQRNFFCVFSF